MEIGYIFQIAAVSILIFVLYVMLKSSGREDLAVMLMLAGVVVILAWLLPYISEQFSAMQALFEFSA